MVDWVTDRSPSSCCRRAIRMAASTLDLIRRAETPKGDVLAVARVAAIQGAKRTSDLIPLCHPLPLSGMEVTITPSDSLPGLVISCRCRTSGKTGVEMEAMTSVSIGLLTLCDMLKSVDPADPRRDSLVAQGGRTPWHLDPLNPTDERVCRWRRHTEGASQS